MRNTGEFKGEILVPICIAAAYFPSFEGQTHPLKLVLEDDEIRSHVTEGGIFIDGAVGNDPKIIEQLSAICNGTAFRDNPRIVEPPYERGPISQDAIDSGIVLNVVQDVQKESKLEKPVKQVGTIPKIFNDHVDGGFLDVLRHTEERLSQWGSNETVVVISPSARHIGITALKNAFPGLKMYLAGPMPEDVPRSDWRFNLIPERLYTRLLAANVKTYGLDGITSYGGNAGVTGNQTLIAMGVVSDEIEGYTAHYESRMVGSMAEFKRTVSIEKALRGATFDERGVCRTKLLIGHELAKAEGHDEMHKRIKTDKHGGFNWEDTEGLELIRQYQQVLHNVIKRCQNADFSSESLLLRLVQRFRTSS